MKFLQRLAIGWGALLLLTIPLDRAEGVEKRVRVGIYQNEPKVFLDSNRQPAGFWVDILQEIAQRENWSIQYIPCEWHQCLSAIENGALDLMVDVAYSSERDQRFDFNREVILNNWSIVYARHRVTINTILDLDQKKIAIIRNSIQYDALSQRAKAFYIKPKFIEVESAQQVFEAMDKKQADAGVVNRFFGEHFAHDYDAVPTNLLVEASQLHFIAPRATDQPLLNAIDHQISKMKSNPDSIYYQAQQRWLENPNQFSWKTIKQIIVALFSLVFVLSIVGIIIWHRSLSREINARKQSEEKLKLVTDNMQDLVCLHDADGRLVYISPSCQAILGYSSEELIAQDAPQVIQLQGVNVPSTETARALRSPLVYATQTKAGVSIWLETLTKAIVDDQGQIIHFQSTSRDVTARVQIEEQLKYDARHDSLTGLANRSVLIERIELAIHRLSRHPQACFSLLFLDLDNFKIINDSLGHSLGDLLLMDISQRLKQLVRSVDLVARLGGDEFVILLEDVEGIGAVVEVAERLLTELKHPFQLKAHSIVCHASMGIVLSNPTYTQAEELLRDADIAMYRAKLNGRATYAIFDPSMHHQVLERLHLESDLRQALNRHEFTLQYQPIMTIASGQLQGFEALIRWQHPQRGWIRPDHFIPIAEEMGLIIPLGHWILQTACQQLAQWQALTAQRSLYVAVNLSSRQFYDPQLLEKLDQSLAESGISGKSLVLEITETMLIHNIEKVTHLLDSIRTKGIRISIDDFGTGYSSLSYLYRLPVNSLKIDRSFVNQMQEGQRNYAIVKTVITLGDLLGINVVAEGIETQAQLQALQSLGCELGQGYLLSKPLTTAAAQDFLVNTVQKLAPK
ncbi:EAL domain-containing protein [Synechocystis sp. LKSZ1]|uniref:EAL domain-containing protein n=1 Tax=Synechocystis sp. LKSZ1 TaxID=3144951 RepID=UPI00336BB6CC